MKHVVEIPGFGTVACLHLNGSIVFNVKPSGKSTVVVFADGLNKLLRDAGVTPHLIPDVIRQAEATALRPAQPG